MDSANRVNTFRSLRGQSLSHEPSPLPRNPTLSNPSSPTPSTEVSITGSAGDLPPPLPTKTLQRAKTLQPTRQTNKTIKTSNPASQTPGQTAIQSAVLGSAIHGSLHNLAKIPTVNKFATLDKFQKSNSIQSRGPLSSIQSSTTGSEAPLNLSDDQKSTSPASSSPQVKKKSRKRLCCLTAFSIVLLSTVGILVMVTMNIARNEDLEEMENNSKKKEASAGDSGYDDLSKFPPKVTLKSSIFDKNAGRSRGGSSMGGSSIGGGSMGGGSMGGGSMGVFGLQNDHKCQFFNSSIPKSNLGILHKKAPSGDVIKQQGIWLTDNLSLHEGRFKEIRTLACNDQIPVIVISLSSGMGIKLMDDQKSFSDHSMEFSNGNAVPTIDPDTYETVIKTIVQKLKNMPVVIVFEPDFLEKTFNQRYQQYRWDNAIIEDLVMGKGLQKLINSLPMAKVYLDVGSLSYLLEFEEHLFHVATNLNRVENLQGFAVNTGKYVNTTTSHAVAKKLSCLTNGLHYVIDTSRNGGSFSKENHLTDVERGPCSQDPVGVKPGMAPVWAWGIRTGKRKRRELEFKNDQNHEKYQNLTNHDQKSREKRSLMKSLGDFGGGQRATHGRPGFSKDWVNYGKKGGGGGRVEKGPIILEYKTTWAQTARKKHCLRVGGSGGSNNKHDAYLWLKTLGESDGRLGPFGSFIQCIAGDTGSSSRKTTAFGSYSGGMSRGKRSFHSEKMMASGGVPDCEACPLYSQGNHGGCRCH